MAEAVVGAAVDVLVKNLIALSVEEIGLIRNFSKDLDKLKDSVVTIQKFLEDAGAKEVTEESVTRWLMKLQDAVFEADEVFDTLNYEVLRKKVQSREKTKKKVRCFFPNSKSLSFRHKMARKIKEVNSKLKSINDEATGLGLHAAVIHAPAAGARAESQEYMETNSFTVDRILVGRENDAMKIVKMVSGGQNEQAIYVLPIVGMGGLGKTTLARKVYNDDTIISHFEHRIWVYVSSNFVPEMVYKSILSSLTGEDIGGSTEVILRKIREIINNKRYLLVLDDVWNEHVQKWDSFITSLEGVSAIKGNVVIVTTRKTSVSSIVKTSDVHELGALFEEDCWLIIKTKAFGGEQVPSYFESIGKKIAQRCGGVPLAANVVGSLLRGKSEEEWLSIEKNWLSDVGPDGDAVSKILKLSFDNLPSPLLKKCFAYISIIPKGWSMEKDEAIQYWMAEGFLQNDQGKDMEIVGNTVFNILLESSLLEVWKRDIYGNVIRCGMHDLVHDLASSILNSKFPLKYISRSFVDESSPISVEQAKCLRGLFFSGKISPILFSNMRCLHTLILNDREMEELPSEIRKLKSLRLLDISHTKIEYLPDSIGDLYHLQTLRATVEYGGESSLKKLPRTSKFLISLRHLYISNIKLPAEIGKLSCLQTLPYFQVGDEMGCGIMELGCLNNLKGEIEIHNLEKVRDKEDAKSAKLSHKQNISKLKLVWNESREGEGEASDKIVLEGLQPHKNLKSLEINGFKGRSFPSWTLRMSVTQDLQDCWIRLDNLLEVKLSDCKECEEIPMLGHLPCLKSLSLHHLSNVRCLGSSFYGMRENEVNNKIVVFPALEKLELIDMENLTAWKEVELLPSFGTQPHEVLVFQHLENLQITNCRQLKSAPSHFPCLKELKIDNMESCQPLENICGSKLTTLTKLVISNVDGMVSLPEGLLHNNGDLLELEITSCNDLLSLVPYLGGGGSSLRKLWIKDCSCFNELPEDLHSLHALHELVIWNCPNLKSIPYPSDTHLSSQGFTSLRELDFLLSSGLTSLPCEMLVSCANSLQSLRLTGSTSLSNFPQVMSIIQKMPRLTLLGIEGVPKVNDVAEEIGSLPSLQTLYIGGSPDCGDYITFKASLDRIFPALKCLRFLSLGGMEEWDTIPEQLLHLTTIRALIICNFGIEGLPEWIGKLPSLIDLMVYRCPKLKRLASKEAMLRLCSFAIFQCPLLEQNVEQQGSDSEWHKISHIPYITVNQRPFHGPAL